MLEPINNTDNDVHHHVIIGNRCKRASQWVQAVNMISGPVLGAAFRYKIWCAKGVAQQLGHVFGGLLFWTKFGPTNWPTRAQILGAIWQAEPKRQLVDHRVSHDTKTRPRETIAGPKMRSILRPPNLVRTK